MTEGGVNGGESGRLQVAVAGCHRMLTRQSGSHNWAAGFAAVAATEIEVVYEAGAQTR